MPAYEFQLVGGGEIIERYYPARDCPELGSVLMEQGKTYRRILSTPRIQPVWKPYASHSLPRGAGMEKLCKFNEQGLPMVETQAQEREIMAHTGRIRD